MKLLAVCIIYVLCGAGAEQAAVCSEHGHPDPSLPLDREPQPARCWEQAVSPSEQLRGLSYTGCACVKCLARRQALLWAPLL